MSYRRWITADETLLVITAEEDSFLTAHGIDQHDVFDGTGLDLATLALHMEREEHWRVAIGVSACERGHAMRDRQGRCVMCHPSTLLEQVVPPWLTHEEAAFLTHHGIAFTEVLIAKGLKRARYTALMRQTGKIAAVGVTRCIYGHALRDRHGKCLFCNPSSLAYSKRYRSAGFVYLAYSKKGRLYKVGSSGDLCDRVEQLNVQGYGDRNDWELVAQSPCNEAGRVENAVQQRLAKYSVAAGYTIRDEQCRELFRCSKAVAIKAFRQATLMEE